MEYKKYAKLLNQYLIKNGEEKFNIFFDNFILWLKSKNKIKLLPNILDELKRIKKRKDLNKKSVFIIKDKNDFEKYKKEIEEYSDNFSVDDLKIVEDKNIVGGYILKNKKYKVDNSYKKKLLDLYRRIIL